MKHPILLLLAAEAPWSTDAVQMQRLSSADFRVAAASKAVPDEPVIVEDVVDERQCGEWLHYIKKRSRREIMAVRRGSDRQRLEMTLGDALELLIQSSREDPISAASLGSSCSTDQLPLYDVLDGIHDPAGDDEDWLPLLSAYAPTHDTLALSGAGAASDLCSYALTGSSLCLSGKQLWRALPPGSLSLPDEPIRREAWDGYSFSMGRRSRSSLYAGGGPGRDDGDGDPAALGFTAECAEELRPDPAVREEPGGGVAMRPCPTGKCAHRPPGMVVPELRSRGAGSVRLLPEVRNEDRGGGFRTAHHGGGGVGCV